jgi:hypothetical protein
LKDVDSCWSSCHIDVNLLCFMTYTRFLLKTYWSAAFYFYFHWDNFFRFLYKLLLYFNLDILPVSWGHATYVSFIKFLLILRHWLLLIIPSPTKLRRDIVMLPSVLPSFRSILKIWPGDLDLWPMTLKINRVPDSHKD